MKKSILITVQVAFTYGDWRYLLLPRIQVLRNIYTGQCCQSLLGQLPLCPTGEIDYRLRDGTLRIDTITAEFMTISI